MSKSSNCRCRQVFAALLIVAAGAGVTAQADPVAVQQQLLDALARGDVGGALTFFTSRRGHRYGKRPVCGGSLRR